VNTPYADWYAKTVPSENDLRIRTAAIAIAWATANFGLTFAVVPTSPFPWLAMLGFVAGPLLFIFFAGRIAERLHRGLMTRWATDFRKPQSVIPIMLIGWVALFAQTVFLLARIG
jgi:hypothetical protein